MSFETDYHPRNLEVARTIFAALNSYATQMRGQYLLSQCNIAGFVVRGSAGNALEGHTPIFTRAINDIDLRILAANPHYDFEHLPSLMRFISAATQHAGLNLGFRARGNGGSRLSHKLRSYLYPRIDIAITPNTDDTQVTHMHVSLSSAVPDVAPLPQTTFMKAENPSIYLAEKIRTLHNTVRIEHAHGLSVRDDEARKIRRTLDILDTYQAYHIALAHAGSHDAVLLQLKSIYDSPFYSQFNIRTSLSVVHDNLKQGYLYANLRAFDEQHDIQSFIPQLIQRMKTNGMIEVHADLDPARVMATSRMLMDLMPLPISKTLLRLRRPNILRHLRRIKITDHRR